MGICRLPPHLKPNARYRRIDMKAYPRSMFAFALSYFTGPDVFNRCLNLHASHLGFALNDKGLYTAVRKFDKGGPNVSGGGGSVLPVPLPVHASASIPLLPYSYCLSFVLFSFYLRHPSS
jgi:hypothetical protein